jgi:hypothetical protein
MSPALASWIQANGKQLYSFPSKVYKTVQLWYIPDNHYDAVADNVITADGAFINTVGSHCGGYTITDSSSGSFYTEYQALGGKGMLGDPLDRTIALSGGGHQQLFDGAVLMNSPHAGTVVRPLPIVAMLASRSPAAYQKAGLPKIVPGTTDGTRRAWLTNPAITRAYLNGETNTSHSYAAAVQRYGEPLGPPVALAGGTVGQAFANVVLEVSAGQGAVVHAAQVTKTALAAGLLRIPAAAQAPQPAPPLANPLQLGPSKPTTIEPFVITLGVAIAVFGLMVLMLAGRRHQRRREAGRADSGMRPRG